MIEKKVNHKYPSTVTLTFDGRTYTSEKTAGAHEEKMCTKIQSYLSKMPHAVCYDIKGDRCTAYYVSDDLDWVYLKLEIARLEDQLGYHSVVVNDGIRRLYRLKTSEKDNHILLAPFDYKYLASGKIDSQVQTINAMVVNYKKECCNDEEECPSYYL